MKNHYKIPMMAGALSLMASAAMAQSVDEKERTWAH